MTKGVPELISVNFGSRFCIVLICETSDKRNIWHA